MFRDSYLLQTLQANKDRVQQHLDMTLLRSFVTRVSPIFLVTSPVTSYADQIYSIHRSRSIGGFSLDIPLIMLVASITKVFYWFGVHYDLSLLFQACLMIFVQVLLLHVALSNRTSQASVEPFAGAQDAGRFGNRPYDFWQWRPSRPYWLFLGYFSGALVVLQLLLGRTTLYVHSIGYFALAVEGTLPLPQIYNNHANRSCKGFRLSVLANWLVGDLMKMSFFFLSETTITWPFKLCGMFQFACDLYLGVQYLHFGGT